MFGVVHVADHGHDAADAAALGSGRRHEDREVGVAREVARAADAVHDARAHHVGGVHVAVQVGLDHAVHGNQAQAADHLGVVADLLRPQHDALAVEVQVFGELFHHLGRERNGGGRGHAHLAALEQGEHAVLQHLGVALQAGEGAVVQAFQHGVGDVAHARLQRQQVFGQAALLHLVLEEVHQVAGDAARGFVGRAELRVAVGQIRFHHGDHLGRVAVQVRRADAVAGIGHRDRLAVWRALGAVVDVVHALQRQRVAVVDFQDHLVGLVQPGLVVAHRGGRDQAPVFEDARDFDHRHVQFAQEAEPHVLRHVREVDVGVGHLAGVDAGAAGRVGLVGQAHVHAAHLGQRAVEFGCSRRAGPQADAEGLSGVVPGLDVLGQGQRHGLGVARAGETAHAHVVAVVDEGGGRVGRHDFLAQPGVGDAGREDGGRVLGHGVQVLGLTLVGRYRNGSVVRPIR